MNNITSELENNKDYEGELLLQLHQQFAENQNKHLDRLLTTLIGLLIIFGIYGACFGISTGLLEVEGYHVAPAFTLFIGFGVSIVLTTLLFMTIQQGYQFRRDQALNTKIREYYLSNERFECYFGNYQGKNKYLLTWMPSHLNPKIFLFTAFYILFLLSSVAFPCFINLSRDYILLFAYVVYMWGSIFLFCFILLYYWRQYHKYKNLHLVSC